MFTATGPGGHAALSRDKSGDHTAALSSTSLQALFEFSMDGVLFTAPDGRIFAANPAACAMLGMSENEVCQAGRHPLMDPTDERWADALEERRRTGRVRAQVRMRRADGTTFTTELTSAVFEVADGEPRSCTIFRDVSELVALMDELHSLAIVDPLTGVRNRRGFMLAAKEHLALADRGAVRTMVLFCDVDNMKVINDSFGHNAGDDALVRVAQALCAATRTSDVVGRIGGDEFAMLLYAAGEDDALTVTRRIRSELKVDRALLVTVSTGALIRDPMDSRSVEALLASADSRMYAQKAVRRSAQESR